MNARPSPLDSLKPLAGRALEAALNRLLTLDRDLLSHIPTVEIAHEALIREWKRLREWLSLSREDIRKKNGNPSADSLISSVIVTDKVEEQLVASLIVTV